MGLLFRRWIDVPVFIAANVLVDVEVLADIHFTDGWPVHQFWHFHTLLVGGLAGAIFGATIYFIKPFRWCCEKSMALIGLGGRATLRSMTLAGLLGVWLHVLIDSFYHYDVQIFWPHAVNPVFRWVTGGTLLNQDAVQRLVVMWCFVFWILMFLLYGVLLLKKSINKHKKREIAGTKNHKFADDKP